MVIVVFIRKLSLGGAEKQSLLLSRELSKKFVTLLVVWKADEVAPVYDEFIKTHGLQVVFLKGPGIVKFFKLWHLLVHQHVTHLFNFLLINNLMGGVAGRLAGVHRIYGGIRNCEIPYFKKLWQRFIHNYLSHKTIFNNYSGLIAFAGKNFRPDKAVVIHNGIDIEGQMYSEKQRGNKVVILTAARFLPQKDHFTALRAIQKLKMEGYDFLYILAGYGPDELLIRQKINELKIGDKVKVEISPSDLHNLYARAHLYLCTSLKEGLSNSIMEARAAGLPVVATNAGDNRYLVNDGINGRLIGKRDHLEVARALAELIDDQELRDEMGYNGYQLLKNHFTISHFLGNYLKLITDANGSVDF